MAPARWEEIFTEASDACGIHCTPHMLRHTFAIYYLSALIKEIIGTIDEYRAKGQAQYGQLVLNPLISLQWLLGHSRVETTYIYLNTIDECESKVLPIV